MNKLGLFLALLGLTAAQPVFGDYWALETTSGGFSGNGLGPKAKHVDWMNGLPDSMRISELSIPGTHDAGTESYYGAFASAPAVCQDATVKSQLESGVRFLDLRVSIFGGEWLVHHNGYEFRNIFTLLNEIDTFLTAHPSEAILVRLSADRADFNDGAPNGDWNAFINVLYPAIVNNYDKIWQREGKYRADGVTPTTYADNATPEAGDDYFWTGSSYHWPTLGEVRGQMVMFVGPNPLLMQQKGHTSGFGWYNKATGPPNPIDGFQISNSDTFDNFFWKIKFPNDYDFIKAASEDRRKTVLYATGINIGFTTADPYNPLDLGYDPHDYAKHMNRLLLNKLNDQTNNLRKTGLVLMDFPGPGLLSSMIALNFRHNTSASSVYPSFHTYAYQLPFEDNLNFEYQPTWQARGWRRLVKERIPSTEFNTFVSKGAIISFTHTISDSDPNTLSAAVGPLSGGWDTNTIGVLFQSHDLPPAYTNGDIKGRLDTLLSNGSPDVQTIKSVFKTEYPLHDWTVFSYFTYKLPNEGLPDFDKNVVWAESIFWNGTNYAKTIVAGSRKPNLVSTSESSRSVVGHWEFPASDLTKALVGNDLGSGLVSVTGAAIVPQGTTGIEMRHGDRPNGGPSAIRMHQWTLVMDLAGPVGPTIGRRSLLQIDSPDDPTSTDGDLFIANGGIGIGFPYYGQFKPWTWHRVVVAVDATQEQLMSFYIDGSKVGEIPARTFTATGDVVNGYVYSNADRWSLQAKSLLFGDDNGESGNLYVRGIQLRNYKMSDAEVAALGGASAAGIPDDTLDLSVERTGLVLETDEITGFQRMNDTFLKDHVKVSWNSRHQLQQSNHLGGPWSDVPAEQTIESPWYFKTEGVNRQFFRLRLR